MTNEKPFFVKFLEGQEDQEFPKVKTNVQAGRPLETQKYPSDGDEGGV